jgi:hypothetical protein
MGAPGKREISLQGAVLKEEQEHVLRNLLGDNIPLSTSPSILNICGSLKVRGTEVSAYEN